MGDATCSPFLGHVLLYSVVWQSMDLQVPPYRLFPGVPPAVEAYFSSLGGEERSLQHPTTESVAGSQLKPLPLVLRLQHLPQIEPSCFLLYWPSTVSMPSRVWAGGAGSGLEGVEDLGACQVQLPCGSVPPYFCRHCDGVAWAVGMAGVEPASGALDVPQTALHMYLFYRPPRCGSEAGNRCLMFHRDSLCLTLSTDYSWVCTCTGKRSRGPLGIEALIFPPSTGAHVLKGRCRYLGFSFFNQ